MILLETVYLAIKVYVLLVILLLPPVYKLVRPTVSIVMGPIDVINVKMDLP